ncbi:hypothetical protein AURDEDRAFT_172490 [Auricularia subglabra TFB-10046 SS5]|nr:hypothetical protein AURDEDRAFT_172490 [Auricularia subglabra TFB-10046 SS5]
MVENLVSPLVLVRYRPKTRMIKNSTVTADGPGVVFDRPTVIQIKELSTDGTCPNCWVGHSGATDSNSTNVDVGAMNCGRNASLLLRFQGSGRVVNGIAQLYDRIKQIYWPTAFLDDGKRVSLDLAPQTPQPPLRPLLEITNLEPSVQHTLNISLGYGQRPPHETVTPCLAIATFRIMEPRKLGRGRRPRAHQRNARLKNNIGHTHRELPAAAIAGIAVAALVSTICLYYFLRRHRLAHRSGSLRPYRDAAPTQVPGTEMGQKRERVVQGLKEGPVSPRPGGTEGTAPDPRELEALHTAMRRAGFTAAALVTSLDRVHAGRDSASEAAPPTYLS